MKKLMFHVHRAGEMEGFQFDRGNSSNWTTDKARRLFDKVFHRFHFPSIGGRRVRYEALMWKTFHNHLQKNQWKFVGER